MSAEVGREIPGSARKKHRHDLGHEDHGPKVSAGTTRGIQAILGLWIALTFAALVWAMIDSARSETTAAEGPSPTTSTAAPAPH